MSAVNSLGTPKRSNSLFSTSSSNSVGFNNSCTGIICLGSIVSVWSVKSEWAGNSVASINSTLWCTVLIFNQVVLFLTYLFSISFGFSSLKTFMIPLLNQCLLIFKSSFYTKSNKLNSTYRYVAQTISSSYIVLSFIRCSALPPNF